MTLRRDEVAWSGGSAANGSVDETGGRNVAEARGRGLRVKTAVTLLVLGSVLLAAVPLQWIWWRTARDGSLQLVDVLAEQITMTVRREFWERVVASEAAFEVASSLLGEAPDAASAIRSLEAALRATLVPSRLSYSSAASGAFVVAREASGGITSRAGPHVEDAETPSTPVWKEIDLGSAGGGAVAFTGSAGAGALSVAIGLDRFSALLAAIPVGRTGGAFVVDARGSIKVMPGSGAMTRLDGVVAAAGAVVAARSPAVVNIVEARRLIVDADAYRVSFSPLEFNGWQFVVIVPEREFLGDIESTMRRALLGLLGLVLALGGAAALAAQRVLSRPVAALTGDLDRIKRFELEDIRHRPGGLREFDELSGAIARMATGLADFAKFIPTDLVRMLLAEGVRAAPGGESRQLTVMFADVAGFTKLSERMGTAVIGIVSRYLDIVSGEVERSAGTVDKFIGDAVMAFWGAPRPDSDQACNACLAALAAIEAVRAADLVDDQGELLRMRIGVHSGAAVVGNIGSARRLNYTAIGDTVNLASRLEGVNKVFGTAILISDATRIAAGERIVARELAEIAVAGKDEPIVVHELLAMAGTPPPSWASKYAEALDAYRRRKFVVALRLLDGVLADRPDDGPSRWLKAQCEIMRGARPPEGWRGVVKLDSK